MILITNRVSTRAAKVTAGAVNSIVGEIQAIFNRMGVVRGNVPDPTSDYFRFDSSTGKLYLVTIEGDQKEVTLS
jgi:hypothetical protein